MSPSQQPGAGLARYRDLVDDWPAFLDAISRPLPVCVWTNRARIAPEELAALLRDEGYTPEPLPWRDDAFRLGAVEGIGRSWCYRAGLCHVLEEASMLPPVLVGARPGERLLDLCAAPGGKTAQLALDAGLAGTVIANDASISRLRALRSVVDRLGLVNVTLTHRDGCQYPPGAGAFDRALVDAPCSDEGTVRKNANLLAALGTRPRGERTGRQVALLRKAVQLCRPGGRIVYSTCTFAPEENEAVVDRVLRDEAASGLELEEAGVPGLRTGRGVTEWEGRRYDPSLRRAVRIWPHHNDTGGFFVAVLRKGSDAGRGAHEPAIPEPAPAEEWEPHALERFGIPREALQDLLVHRRTRRGLHVTNRAQRTTRAPVPQSIGFLLVKDRIRYPKLSTAGALLLGGHATRNVVDLHDEQLARYYERATFPLDPSQAAACAGTGYVVVRFRGHPLGTGLYFEEERRVRSLFPRRGYPDGGSGAAVDRPDGTVVAQPPDVW